MHWTLRATGRHWLKSLLLKSQATEQFQYNDVGSTRWTLSVTRRGSNEETNDICLQEGPGSAPTGHTDADRARGPAWKKGQDLG